MHFLIFLAIFKSHLLSRIHISEKNPFAQHFIYIKSLMWLYTPPLLKTLTNPTNSYHLISTHTNLYQLIATHSNPNLPIPTQINPHQPSLAHTNPLPTHTMVFDKIGWWGVDINKNHGLEIHFKTIQAFLTNIVFYPYPTSSLCHRWGGDKDRCLDKATTAFEKFVVGWGGLFDYSVYSWPSFNQEWNQAMVEPC